MISGEQTTWSELDETVMAKLNELAGQEVVLLTQTFASPTTSQLISDLQEKYPNIKHVVYDSISESEALDAFQDRFGYRALPDYDFSEAEVIVSVGADFLGDWHGGGFDASYAKSRIPNNGKMSRHIHFGANMTLTDANADNRFWANAREQKQIIKALTGNGSTSGLSDELVRAVQDAKKQLNSAGGKGVLLTGLPDFEAQKLTFDYNLAVYSMIMDIETPKFNRLGSSTEVSNLIDDVISGKVKGLISVGVDPLYSFPNAEAFAEAYVNLPFTL